MEAKKSKTAGASSNLRTKLSNSTIFACIESVFSLGEYLLVLLVVTAGTNNLTKGTQHTSDTFQQCSADRSEVGSSIYDAFQGLCMRVFCIINRDLGTVVAHTAIVFIASAIVVCWMGWRCLAPFKKAWLSLPPWLGMRSPRISAIGVIVLLTDIFTFLLLIWIQCQNERWFMSFSNYMAVDDATGDHYIKYSRVVSILFADPLKEEVMFRGCLFYLLYRRNKQPFASLLLSNALFGAFHMLNLVGSHFSPFYVFLQVLLGFEIGSFFGLRFLVTGSLWEPLVLHITNNLLSGFLPVQEAVVLKEPAVFYTLVFTVAMYGVLNTLSVLELKRKIKTNKDNKDSNKAKLK